MIFDSQTSDQVKNGDRHFFYETHKTKDYLGSNWRTIISYEQGTNQNLINSLMLGGVRNRVYAYNINTNEHVLFEYDREKDDGKFKINPNSFTIRRSVTSSIYGTGDKVGNFSVVPIQSEREEQRIKKEILARAFLSKVVSNIIVINIHGDSELTVGSPVYIHIPEINNYTKKKDGEMLSGIYIIAKLRHVLKPITGDYMQACELIRSGFLEK